MLKKALFSPLFLFIVIVIASSIFRITNLDVVEFKKDEAINLFLASRPFFGHPFPPGSTVSSLGILNPPLLNYILFPILIFSFNPIFISFYIGLINSISIGFLFLIVKRYYNIQIALIAGLLMAFSPWAILFSRKIWAQDFIIPLFIPVLFSIHKIIFEKKTIYWIPLVSFSLFLAQLHQSTLFFSLILIIFILFKKGSFNLKYLAIGLLIGLLPMLPYILYQVSNNCLDCQAFFATGNRLSPIRSFKLFMRVLQITNSGDFRFILGDDMTTLATQFPIVYKARSLFYLEYLLLPFGILFFLKRFNKIGFLAISSIILPVIYFLLRIESFIHYFIIISPLLFIFLASGFYYFLSLKNNLFKILTLIILASILITSFAFNFAFFNILTRQKNFKGDYGGAFINTQKETEKRFVNYKNSKEYNEMIIFSYLPKDLMYGYLPLSKMIFSYSGTQKRISFLEKRLMAVPVDERVQIELLAYYTQKLPSAKTLKLIKRKSLKNPGYIPIYQEIEKVYRENNRK